MSIAARDLANGTGPRTTASAIVVARAMSPERSITLASAVGPSSQGVWKTRWSLAETAAKPHSRAASTASASRSAESRSSPNRISGRWTPRSTAPCSQLPLGDRHASPDAPERDDRPRGLEQQEPPLLAEQRQPGEQRRADDVEQERGVRTRSGDAELHRGERGKHRERAKYLEQAGHEVSFERRRHAGYGAPSRPGRPTAGRRPSG